MTHLAGISGADVLGAACPSIFLIAVLAIGYLTARDRRRKR
ncbi:hypothetical protein [Streptomyces caniscabiei]|uniref:Secreted protein n=1 Tax=Streptomyces caniscabiei TaxID=2746961 RepID=A0ABU4MJ39_9ACTN|nr:hypothetical protein [Streptomyces caniscabiei]MDX3009611.1 hypothetical protein [Streptomyces caniscabiei]MDX3037256.1 hypothetical protein [Streptomyces caniscabiei]